MSQSLEAMLALIKADLPERLISSETFLAIRSLCRHLPVDFSSGFGFETRLSDKAAVDFMVRMPAPLGRQFFANSSSSCTLPDSSFDEFTWQRLHTLALDFQTWPEELRGLVRHLWLEFDAQQYSGLVPCPGLLFLQLTRCDFSGEDYDRITGSAYRVIRNPRMPSGLVRSLIDCRRYLPHRSMDLLIGLGVYRPYDGVRLVIADLALAEILRFLDSMCWPGDLRELEIWLVEMTRYIRQVNVNIDLLDSIAPRIGIECCLGGEKNPRPALSCRDFLNLLVHKGLCLAEKSESLLKWPGRNMFLSGRDLQPWIAERLLSHVKLDYDPTVGVEAKAYFGLIWRRASANFRNGAQEANGVEGLTT